MNMKKYLVVGIVAALIIILGVIAVVLLAGKPAMEGSHDSGGTDTTNGTGAASSPATPITNITFTKSSYDVALSRAIQWEPDAAIRSMLSLDATGNSWSFTFVSPKNKGKGLTVVVNGGSVASADQITLVAGGTVFPTNVIAPDDAIAEAHAIPGYANVAMVSVEMIYNAAGGQWLWGVKTATGVTLTVKATQ